MRTKCKWHYTRSANTGGQHRIMQHQYMFLLYFWKHNQWSASLSGGNESDALQFIISAAGPFFLLFIWPQWASNVNCLHPLLWFLTVGIPNLYSKPLGKRVYASRLVCVAEGITTRDTCSKNICPLTACHLTIYPYRVSQEEWTKLRESVPYVELYRYNPKHLYPKLNG